MKLCMHVFDDSMGSTDRSDSLAVVAVYSPFYHWIDVERTLIPPPKFSQVQHSYRYGRCIYERSDLICKRIGEAGIGMGMGMF